MLLIECTCYPRLLWSIFAEIEVRPASVLSVEVLLAAILEAETFVEFVGGLLNYETTWIEIAVETTVDGGELQHAIVRVCDAAGIVLCVAIAPDHLFRGGIRQYLHRTSEHHALEALGIAEIDACLGIGLVLSHTY